SDGLTDVVLGTRAQLAMLIERLLAGVGGHDDERHVLERRVFLELVADGKSVHPGQLDGKEDEIGPLRRRRHEPGVTVVDHLRDHAQTPELGPELTGESSVTLEDQDFGGHGRGRSRDASVRILSPFWPRYEYF